MGKEYRVVVQTAGMEPDTIRMLAMQLAGQPEVSLSVEQLAAQLGGPPVELASAVGLERAQALRTIIGAAGGKTEILDPAGNPAGDASPAGTRSPVGSMSATIMGGFHAPPATSGSSAPARPDAVVPAALGQGPEAEDGELVTLDRATDLSTAATARGPAAAPAAPSASAGTGLDVDSLDASSLVLLDGTDESQSAQPIARPQPPPVDEPPAATNDPRFRPPAESGQFSPPEAGGALELDMPAPPPQVAPPAPEPVVPLPAVDEAAPAMEPPLDHTFDPDQKTGPQAPQKVVRRARRRRMTVALVAGLRERAHLRVLLGFGLALGLGAVIPNCHARSIMETKVHRLRVELSTATAHGPSATPGYDSVAQIEERIASIKLRHGFYSLFLWLAGAGLLLFLWFRFV